MLSNKNTIYYFAYRLSGKNLGYIDTDSKVTTATSEPKELNNNHKKNEN